MEDEKQKMLQKLLEMKKEVARKQKKLERAKRAARVKAHVRRKIREHEVLESSLKSACGQKKETVAPTAEITHTFPTFDPENSQPTQIDSDTNTSSSRNSIKIISPESISLYVTSPVNKPERVGASLKDKDKNMLHKGRCLASQSLDQPKEAGRDNCGKWGKNRGERDKGSTFIDPALNVTSNASINDPPPTAQQVTELCGTSFNRNGQNSTSVDLQRNGQTCDNCERSNDEGASNFSILGNAIDNDIPSVALHKVTKNSKNMEQRSEKYSTGKSKTKGIGEKNCNDCGQFEEKQRSFHPSSTNERLDKSEGVDNSFSTIRSLQKVSKHKKTLLKETQESNLERRGDWVDFEDFKSESRGFRSLLRKSVTSTEEKSERVEHQDQNGWLSATRMRSIVNKRAGSKRTLITSPLTSKPKASKKSGSAMPSKKLFSHSKMNVGNSRDGEGLENFPSLLSSKTRNTTENPEVATDVIAPCPPIFCHRAETYDCNEAVDSTPLDYVLPDVTSESAKFKSYSESLAIEYENKKSQNTSSKTIGGQAENVLPTALHQACKESSSERDEDIIGAFPVSSVKRDSAFYRTRSRGVSSQTEAYQDTLSLTPSFKSPQASARPGSHGALFEGKHAVTDSEFLNILGIPDMVRSESLQSGKDSSNTLSLLKESKTNIPCIKHRDEMVQHCNEVASRDKHYGEENQEGAPKTNSGVRAGRSPEKEEYKMGRKSSDESSPMFDSFVPASQTASEFSDYTELDSIPFSQFELSEDFLTEDSQSLLVQRSKGALVRRRSTRKSFAKLSPQGSLLESSYQTSRMDNNAMASIFTKSRFRRQSQVQQRKAAAVLSIFQFLMDKARKPDSAREFDLPPDFDDLMNEKMLGPSGVQSNQLFFGRKQTAIHSPTFQKLALLPVIAEDIEKNTIDFNTKSHAVEYCSSRKYQSSYEKVSPETVSCSSQNYEHRMDNPNVFIKSSPKEAKHAIKTGGLETENDLELKIDDMGTETISPSHISGCFQEEDAQMKKDDHMVMTDVALGPMDSKAGQSESEESNKHRDSMSSPISTSGPPVTSSRHGAESQELLLEHDVEKAKSQKKVCAISFTDVMGEHMASVHSRNQDGSNKWDSGGLDKGESCNDKEQAPLASEMTPVGGHMTNSYPKAKPEQNGGTGNLAHATSYVVSDVPPMVNTALESQKDYCCESKSDCVSCRNTRPVVESTEGAYHQAAAESNKHNSESMSEMKNSFANSPSDPFGGSSKNLEPHVPELLQTSSPQHNIENTVTSPTNKVNPILSPLTPALDRAILRGHSRSMSWKSISFTSTPKPTKRVRSDSLSMSQQLDFGPPGVSRSGMDSAALSSSFQQFQCIGSFTPECDKVPQTNADTSAIEKLPQGGSTGCCQTIAAHEVSYLSLVPDCDESYPSPGQIPTAENSSINLSELPQNVTDREAVTSTVKLLLDDTINSLWMAPSSPHVVHPWKKLPRTATTPVQVLEAETSGCEQGAFSFTSNQPRAKTKSQSQCAVTTSDMKFVGCFQSDAQDAVVALLCGSVISMSDPTSPAQTYIVSVLATSLTVWGEDAALGWTSELDWRLSQETHILKACLMPGHARVAVLVTGWVGSSLFVSVMTYEWYTEETLRFNIPLSNLPHQLSPLTAVELCPGSETGLFLGLSSHDHHCVLRADLSANQAEVLSSHVFRFCLGRLLSVVLVENQKSALLTLSADQKITLWNCTSGIALKTVAVCASVPCLEAVVSARTIKGLVLLDVLWRLDEGSCGGVLVMNPLTSGVVDTVLHRYQVPNNSWRRMESCKKEGRYITGVGGQGSVCVWDSLTGVLLGCTRSKLTTCASMVESGRSAANLIVGEIHGCLHMYSSSLSTA